MNNRKHITAKVKSKYWLKDQKFWIKVLKNMRQAIDFDRENGNTLQKDAVCKEMKNICSEFEPWEKPEGYIPPRYQEIKCHFIFDIKMGENFQ